MVVWTSEGEEEEEDVVSLAISDLIFRHALRRVVLLRVKEIPSAVDIWFRFTAQFKKKLRLFEWSWKR